MPSPQELNTRTAQQGEGPQGLPPLRCGPFNQPKQRTVGFQTTDSSPSSVLRGQPADAESPASTSGRHGGESAVQSPLAVALRRERSVPLLPQLPKLKLGLKGKAAAGMQRSKSHGNLRQASVAAPVPPAPKSATSSPHAASSGGSEPVRIPFELSRRPHRRTQSVDLVAHPERGSAAAAADGAADSGSPDAELSCSVISAASSLLGHHLCAGLAGLPGAGSSARGSPSGASGGPTRSQSAARDLYLAHADAVTAHAQVHSLQGALRREQDEVLRLREQLQLMTAERDRLLSDLQQGGGDAVFDLEGGLSLRRSTPGAKAGSGMAGSGKASGGSQVSSKGSGSTPPSRPRSALRTVFRLPA